MNYDIHNAYDPYPRDTEEDIERVKQKLVEYQQAMRKAFPRLRDEIESEDRDLDSVYNAARPFYESSNYLPMHEDDLPVLEHFCRRILELRGPRSTQIQKILLRMIGATASPESAPFLQEMWRYSRQRDHFGPERRQLALWGLARIAVRHELPEAYATLQEGLGDPHADVRYTAVDFISDAYYIVDKKIPLQIMERVRDIADLDPDKVVQRLAHRSLQQTWAKEA